MEINYKSTLKKNVTLILFVVLLETVAFISFLPNAAGTARFDFNPFFIVQIFIVIIAFSFGYKRFISLSITLALLILGNFLLTPLSSQYSIKIPKNLYRQFEIRGPVIPGFNGVSTVTTDSQGFRTLDNVDYRNRGSTYRIVTIGGSTTQQVYLDDQKTWTHLLSKQLNEKGVGKIEVINAGFSGPRAENHFYTLKSIEWLKPDLVIFLMGINDWNHDIRTKLSTEGPINLYLNKLLENMRFAYQFRFEHSPIGLVKRNLFNYQHFQDFSRKDITIVDGVDFAKQHYNSLERRQIVALEMNQISDDYQHWLGKIFSECKVENLLCMFVNQPTAYSDIVKPELKEKLWMTPPAEVYSLSMTNLIQISSLYNKTLLKMAKNEGFPVCDLASAIPPTTDFLYDDCHFNEGGARAVSNSISQCISSDISKFDGNSQKSK